MESGAILPSDDVLQQQIAPRMNYDRIIAFSFANKHLFQLFHQPNFWEKLTTRDFGISIPLQQKFPCKPQQRYKTLELLFNNKNLPQTVKYFCAYPANHEKLLACLANDAKLMSLLPESENAIWLHVALVTDLPVVYQAIYQRQPENINRLILALKMGNADAVSWLRVNLPDPETENRLFASEYEFESPVSHEWLRLVAQSDNLALFLVLLEEFKSVIQTSFLGQLFFTALANGSVQCLQWLKNELDKNGVVLDKDRVLRAALTSRSEASWQFVLGHEGVYDAKGIPDPRLLALMTEPNIMMRNLNIDTIIQNGDPELTRLFFPCIKADMILTQEIAKYPEKALMDWHRDLVIKAVKADNICALEFLVTLGSESITRYKDLVQFALSHKQAEMVKYLISSHFFTYFADLQNEDIAIYFMIDHAIDTADFGFVQYILDNIAAQTPNGDAIMRQFLENNADPPPQVEGFFDIGEEIEFYMSNTFLRLRYPDVEKEKLNGITS